MKSYRDSTGVFHRTQFASRGDYQSGDPTSVVMKSRDPMARFTCKSCGVVNAPAGDR